MSLSGGGALVLALAVGACSSFGTTAEPGVTPEGDSGLDAGAALDVTVGMSTSGTLRAAGVQDEERGLAHEGTRHLAPYTPVRLEVDLVGRTYSYRLGTDAGKSGKLATGEFAAGRLYVLLGAPYATGVTQPWHVRVDDVKVEAL